MFLTMFCPHVAAGQQNADMTRKSIDSLLASGEIARVSIIHVPVSLETRTRINQETLRKLSRIEVSFMDLKNGSFCDGLRASLVELSSAKSGPDREVRWGVLFLDQDGKERAALFFDQTGRFLQVRDDRYTVDGKMLGWLIRQIREALN